MRPHPVIELYPSSVAHTSEGASRAQIVAAIPIATPSCMPITW
jgi:hypothetical protein